jgi:condensin complex subunit 2
LIDLIATCSAINGGVIPFSTQFFHEDYDDGPGFDDSGMDGTPAPDATGEGDLLAETQGLGRRVRPEAVNYAKRAKRVDVRKLKENIWKELKIVTGHKREDSPLVSCLSVH